MVFSSAIFLFVFLPLTFLLSRIVPGQRGKNAVLIAFSLVFYAFGNLTLVPLLLVSVLCNYICGLLIARVRSPSGRRLVMAAAVGIGIGLLCVFKYADFAVGTVNALLGTALPLPGITLPIGISFYTFQGLSYVIDVYRRPEEVSRSFGKVLLYISFFPQLVAGPIVKYRDVADQIDHRTCTPEMTAEGIVRFVTGLSKKLLLADTVGAAASAVFAMSASELDLRLAWLGAVCYFFQIYYDFSGYSDMAIGLGRMFGFTFRENFLHPYAAGSMKEFWRRWHVSLSSWFRDYLYIPLGGNRKGRLRTALNKLIVFFCTGLWHGANWTFVLWGLWHGACLTLEDWLKEHRIRIPGPVSRVWTILMVLLAFVLFNAESLSAAGVLYAAMFTGIHFTAETTASLVRLLSPSLIAALVLCLLFAFPTAERLRTLGGQRLERVLPALTAAGAVVLLLADIMTLAAASFSPFIYFQF